MEELLRETLLWLTVKEEIVGGVLSVWVVVRDTLLLELFPSPSLTVSVTVNYR